MRDLGLSPSAVQSIIRKSGWVDTYREELVERCAGLTENDFPEGYFVSSVKPSLEKAFQQDLLSDKPVGVDIRETIQRWKLISNFKAQSLLRLILLTPDEYSLADEIKKIYEDVPIGPQDSAVVDRMTGNELERWQEGNIAVFFAGLSVTNIIGLFVSELFFTLEAMIRALCIATCLEFSVKSVSPGITIQHKDIYKTLRRLEGNTGEKITCRLCPLIETCFRSKSYNQIALIYELSYHLRVIKDYRLDFYFEPTFLSFLVQEYMPKGFGVICTVDKILDRVFLNYMISPISLSDYQEKVYRIFEKIKV